MDAERFERLSRRVAAAATRRGALAAVAGAAVAGALGRGGAAAAEVGPDGVPIISCKLPGFTCGKDTHCCTRKCLRGVCACSRRGSACWEPAEGALCCSGRCRKGKCK